ncbi:MAG: hypothetical protein AMJ79_04785 [Phycisphaerae bacterium SM23_30]|nr:MAG: hypothetical protein AMJ79_04785 [Phycisphaerae bacterium SM23_30]
MKTGKGLFCPLYGREISTGKCLDINYERLGLVQKDNFDDIKKITRRSTAELSDICHKCPNQLFPDDNIGEISFVKKQ